MVLFLGLNLAVRIARTQESLQDDIKSPLQLFSSTQLAGLFSVILWGEFTRRQFPRFTVLIMSREVRYPLLPV